MFSTTTAPRIFAAFGEESRANLAAGRWRSVALWPQVMFPHLFFAVLCLVGLALSAISAFRSSAA